MFIAQAFLAETAEALRSGKRDVLDYMTELCDRIDKHESEIQAFVPEKDRRKRLLEEAEELKVRYPDPQSRPPLYGIPVGVKDIFRVDGFPTQAGTQLPSELFAGKEAESVTLLKEAGALIAGKTVTTEFAYFEPGPTRNPHKLEHTPGGSSSGSAAGVACGFFPLALGTQTIGSVIRPAAFCGIVGFKPTFDRIPTEGLLIFSKSADHVGIFSQDVAGIDLVCSILCDNWGSVQSDEHPPMLGVPEGKYVMQASDEGLVAFEEQIAQLEQAGYTIKRRQMFQDIEEINARHRVMTAAEAAQEHAEWFVSYQDLYRPRTAEIIREGQQVSPLDLDRAQRARRILRRYLAEEAAISKIDIWISPAATGEAPEGIHATGDPIMNLPWTQAGLPTMTVPAGMSKNHLPLGLQCTANYRQDERLVSWMQGISEVVKRET